MKKNDIIDAVGKIDDKTVEKVASTRMKTKKRKNVWIKAAAVAASVCLIISGVFYGFNHGGKEPVVIGAYAIENAVYPEQLKIPDEEEFTDEQLDEWLKFREKKGELCRECEGYVDEFVKNTVPVFMAGEKAKGNNTVFSPMNLFMAFSMLAETTDGETRKQILDVIGADSMETLREKANKIWNFLYSDDGSSKCILSNSIWLRDGMEYNENTMKTLAENYYASSFKGKMGSDEYNAEFQRWLSEQTGGILDDFIKKEEFPENTVLALASAVYFSAKWQDEFSAENNTSGIFHSADGDETVEFMNEEMFDQFYKGKNFSAVSKCLYNGTGDLNMRFILPDENTSIYELFDSSEVFDYILNNISYEAFEYAQINFSVPKFEISSEIDLSEGMKELGITDIFDSEKSDFSPSLNDSGVYLDKAGHTAKIMIDEKGCIAAAYTTFMDIGAGGPSLKVDFILDRPFIVVINNGQGFPLFVGIVNNI